MEIIYVAVFVSIYLYLNIWYNKSSMAVAILYIFLLHTNILLVLHIKIIQQIGGIKHEENRFYFIASSNNPLYACRLR